MHEHGALPGTPQGGLDRVINAVNRTLVLLSGLLIFVIMLTTLYGVFTRYVLRDPAIWTLPVTSYLLLWCIYLATPWALQNGDHVRIEFLLQMLPPRLRYVVEILSHLLTKLFLLVFGWQVTRLLLRSWVDGSRDTSMLHLPLAPLQTIIPVAALLMFATAFLLLRQQVYSRKGVDR